MGLTAGVSAKPVFWRGTSGGKLVPSGWIPLDARPANANGQSAIWRRDQRHEQLGGGGALGGLQWATNFSTQPGYITFPQPGMSGEVALPSTVDLYVNDALRMSQEVPSGPFSIQDLPVTTGQGDARCCVATCLGAKQVITSLSLLLSLLKTGFARLFLRVRFCAQEFWH